MMEPMLCPYCHTYAAPTDIVCPGCGKLLPREKTEAGGVQSIRQGRRRRVQTELPPLEDASASGDRTYVDPASYADAKDVPVYADPEVYGEGGEPIVTSGLDRPSHSTLHAPVVRSTDHLPKRRKVKFNMKQYQVNWARVAVVLAAVALVAMVGLALYLTRATPGQRFMARLGLSAPSSALWEVGNEKLDTGDITGAIDYFLKAAQQDEEDKEKTVNVPGLLQLGSAYESAGMLAEAEALYTRIYTEVVPSATDAYTNNIRIFLSQSRLQEAADLMQLAYQKTGSTTFLTQRTELLPQPPEVNIAGAYYEEDKELIVSSPQGFEVYYTFDENAELPQDGILFEEPLLLTEATWKLRAVCVDGPLVSDELNATYYISMPSPSQPYCNLAPNTYTKRKQAQLWVSIEQKTDPNITIYYTIDGSIPDADSPIYTGEPIWLPAGRVTLRAVSVNQYGKAGNMLERTFKFNVTPVPLKAFAVTDDLSGLKPGETRYEDFAKKYGEGEALGDVERTDMEGVCRKYGYHWGYAVFNLNKGVQTLVEAHFTDSFKGPRSTGIGDTLDNVVGKFRDMSQLESPSGNRGLYETSDGSTGYIYKQEDGGHIIRYDAMTPDYHTWRLEYVCSPAGIVTAIDLMYLP